MHYDDDLFTYYQYINQLLMNTVVVDVDASKYIDASIDWIDEALMNLISMQSL